MDLYYPLSHKLEKIIVQEQSLGRLKVFECLFLHIHRKLKPKVADDYSSLKPFKKAANIIAHKKDWPVLYQEDVLEQNKVPVAAVVYTNDMYVDREFSIKLAENIPNMNIWETNLYEHNALRSNGKKVLDSLFKRIS